MAHESDPQLKNSDSLCRMAGRCDNDSMPIYSLNQRCVELRAPHHFIARDATLAVRSSNR
jgi:hypothetical protein